MASYDLNLFDLNYVTTDDPDGFSDNGGYRFELGVNTLTIDPAAVSQMISVQDSTDATFDDDAGSNQVLGAPATINGTAYGSNTNIDAEYVLFVEDSLGNTYTLQFVSMNDDAYNIEAFVVQGAMPPTGEALTIVGRQDMANGTYAYSTSTPSCFSADTKIATPNGPRPAGQLGAGDIVLLARGASAPLALALNMQQGATQTLASAAVKIAPGALAQGLPTTEVVLSAQHRVRLPGTDVLIPAKALDGLPGISRLTGVPVTFVHLVLAHHDLLLAGGLQCESFWPGAMATRAMPLQFRIRLTQIMGPNPQPALPFESLRAARHRLFGAPHKKPRRVAAGFGSS